jgi:tetratricopeptide (TPR) repeat protein
MIRPIFLVGLLLGAACFASAQDTNGGDNFSPEFKTAYEQAVQAFNRQDFDGALKQLDAADKIRAGVPAIENLRGAVYVRQKKFEDAQKIFDAIYQKDKENVMALFNLGETYFLQKNYGEAVKYFQSFTEKSKSQVPLAQYKVFLCDLLTPGKEGEAKKIMDQLAPSVTEPLYYYVNAAYQFRQNEPAKGRGYVASAFRIYPAQTNAAYLDPLFELGYIKPEELRVSTSAPRPEAVPAQEKTAPAAPEISGLDNLLPSLDGKDQDKKK